MRQAGSLLCLCNVGAMYLTTPQPHPHSVAMRFAKGALQRQIDARALSQEDFARIAKVSPTTVLKGCKGEELSKRSGSAILIALSIIPILATDNLEVAL